ncbi:MAG: alpha/beta hydrolase [Bdellovibrionales bacterium]
MLKDFGIVDLPPLVPRHRWKSGEEGFVDIGGGIKLHYVVQGKGSPTVVLFPPGPGNTLESFHSKAFDNLAASARIIYVDPRGVGMSTWDPGAEGKYTAAQQCDDVVKMLDVLGVDECVALGWSFGGFIARQFAERYPDRVAGLIQIAPSLYELPIGKLCGEKRTNKNQTEKELRDIKCIRAVEAEVLLAQPGVTEWIAKAREFLALHGNRTVPLGKIMKNRGFEEDKIDLFLLDKIIGYNAYKRGYWRQQYTKAPSDEHIAYFILHEERDDRYYKAMCDEIEKAKKNAPPCSDDPSWWLGPTLSGQSGIPVLLLEAKNDLTWGKERLENLSKAAEALKMSGNFRLVTFPSNHDMFRVFPNKFAKTVTNFVSALPGRYIPLPSRLPQNAL